MKIRVAGWDMWKEFSTFVEIWKRMARNLQQRISVRDAEIERLKVTSVLTPDHKDVEATRAFLSELVREIDKCIAQLSI